MLINNSLNGMLLQPGETELANKELNKENKIEGETLALIVSRPSRMRDSLRALLRATAQVEIIDVASDGKSALRMIATYQPALVLLASNLPREEICAVLQQTKSKWPQTRCLVLAGTLNQQYVAKAVGADRVLLAGFPANKFYNTIQELLTY
jgi:DNA-binding NarL/FixJ family response regulator